MRNTLTTIIFLLVACALSFSQNGNYEIKEVAAEDITKAMSKGQQPGFKTNLYQTEKKEAESQWNKVVKQGKVKIEEVNNETIATGATIKEISTNPLNVYAIFNQYPTYIELNVFFEEGDAFLTKAKNETEYLAAKKFVRDFAIKMYSEGVEEEFKEEEKKLKGLENDLSSIVKDNDKLHKNISNENQDIDNTKEKISTSELDQERVRKQVQAQKEDLSRLKANGSSEDMIKAAEKTLKSLEGDLKSLEKDEDKMHKNIVDSEAKIRDYERKIADNEHSMELKRTEITAQKEHIYNLQQKLDGIK